MARDSEKKIVTAAVVLSLGDDISTDAIYPGRFMATVLPSETPQHAFADYTDFNACLRKKEIPGGSVIVAKGFARIFLQNAVNLGLQTLACKDIAASEGDELELTSEFVINRTSGRKFKIQPLPPARQAIMAAGGLIPYTRKRLLEKRDPV